MATLSATIPRVSRRVSRTVQKQQKQIVTRIPIRRFRSRSRARTTQRVVVLTAAALAVAGAATATAFFVARRFATRAEEERPGEEVATAQPFVPSAPEVAVDGASQAAGAEVAI